MKKVLLSFLVLMMSLSMVHAAEEGVIPTFQAGIHDIEGTLISVDAKGLVCDFCAQALQKVFMKQDGVAGIHVDLTTKKILISLQAGASMDDATVTQLIIDSGYNVAGIERL